MSHPEQKQRVDMTIVNRSEPRFSLNHMICPRLDVPAYCNLASRLGVQAIELRNDIGQHSVNTLAAAQKAGNAARAAGLEVLSINALQQFNHWTPEREQQARDLIEWLVAAGGRYLVMCPVNLASYRVDAASSEKRLKESLEHLKPLLDDAGVRGLIEPLGFPVCSLRTKREAFDAIEDIDAWDRFGLLQDTFHHYVAGETEAFGRRTDLVHVSGVERTDVARESLEDGHRVLVGPNDIIGNLEQVAALYGDGYRGYLSFEPFSRSVWEARDHESILAKSIRHMTAELTAAA